MSKETTARTLFIALVVCIACSVLVSTTAVVLRPIQKANDELNRMKNVLIAADLVQVKGAPSSGEINELFQQIEGQVVSLADDNEVEVEKDGKKETVTVDDGQVVPGMAPSDVADWSKMAQDPATSIELSAGQDIARIGRISKLQPVYLLKENGRLKRVILPVYGKGLWSTMYGFVALGEDLTTIEALTFYQDGETPGLGGEINNPRWQAKWVGKEAFSAAGQVDIRVIKGTVSDSSPDAIHEVDGISGATLTANGVTKLMQFWLGPEGYGPFLDNLRKNSEPALDPTAAADATTPDASRS